MADLVSYGNADRDIEQAIIALKKGAQLLKYGRKGKPKFCPFRLSSDESSLIWISGSGEKSLKLASIARIIPGQRTVVFRRYLRPEKDYLSFSLIYNKGKRSLDLICKDRVEAEVWIAGLKALISAGQGGRSKIDGWSDGGLYFEDNKELTSNSPTDSSFSINRDTSSPEVSISSNTNSSPKNYQPEDSLFSERSHVSLDQGNMQARGSGSDVFRVSVSSQPSTSSHGSGPDDCDALGDVYVWGEVTCDNLLQLGPDKTACSRADVLLPRLLESSVVLDVNHIACGVRHASLVTKQGEVFTWGEESGGRLGHGVVKDVVQPRLVESLTFSTVDYVACGEFHTCAVTMTGELYTWGDGTYNTGLLGHGTDVSHWIPKRVSGPLEGLHVVTVTCGPWHTALITSMGQLFTFGDGTFGVLGHGDKESVYYPREVDSLLGLRTIAVACGVWHTAAVVEVIVTQSSASVSSGKLFTWGDGDKNRLGQGDKEPRLKPTCVPALIDYNFHKIACGHSLTVGLTTSGHVFTMGSTVYGQLGNPQSDGKVPCLVEDKLLHESVEEVSCGAYHVAVLTTRNEVYTWGKGTNGRLGHGDIDDRKTPFLVDALKDRHVKFIACGSHYTMAICLHKWVSGAEQSQCSACRQAFGFTRKRHNCYNCGLVHCHSCSSRKASRAALAPSPNKPYRVCDSCFAKLSKVAEAAATDRRTSTAPRLSGENKDKLEKGDMRSAKSSVSYNVDLIKQLDNKAAKQGKRATDAFSIGRSSQLKDDRWMAPPKPISTRSVASSRSVSPYSRRPSPPRSATPVPTTSGLSFSKSISDSLKKTNDLLNQEVQMLRSQVDSLRQRCEQQELELQKQTKRAQDAIAFATEESSRSKAAKEVIKSLTAQLKDLAERLPLPNGLETNGLHLHVDGNLGLGFDSTNNPFTPRELARDHPTESSDVRFPNGSGEGVEATVPNESTDRDNRVTSVITTITTAAAPPPPPLSPVGNNNNNNNNGNQVEADWIEQYEPGVYITLMALGDGTRDLKRVRFSRRRFGENQAETWWSENRERVYERYNVRGSDRSSISGQVARRSEGGLSPSSTRGFG
ncbi:PH, RCC1 and FYVE domains-containing protein 1-like [Impatiens glandulifera]|uniref:PH, RCC1 and FYVE domains-containing protein 1-like n=1 Tax=Impatiens glandulifera TaxID=253017 RepID=UPI001FB1217C|nr:PH, RCC1 and FYVE domains-containing protein 1-like [Impatiens glandulifera]XP_047306825.1 PH, RCC1 and FYVE domains-containing protein 1-like [Impatiens glandulifera]XP_047306826.1 PH, RCC1 and FYVE domains-containing protein 1-like [Impatiens glandulifera]